MFLEKILIKQRALNYCKQTLSPHQMEYHSLKHSDFHKIGQLLLNNGRYNGKQIIPENWIVEMTSMQLETPSAYKPERVFPKIGVGYYTFISRDNYIFRDGSNGQYIILNKGKNLLITIMATEKNMKNVTEIFRNLI